MSAFFFATMAAISLFCRRLSFFMLLRPAGELFEHRRPQQAIESALVTLTLQSQPGDDVGIQSHRNLPFNRAVEGIANSVLPETGRQWRNVGVIDSAVRRGSDPCHLLTLLARQRTSHRISLGVLFRSASSPARRPCGPR